MSSSMAGQKMNEIERVRDSEISFGRHGYGGRSISMEEVGGATSSRRHSRRSSWRIDEDEEAVKWAALERLPTYDRLRTSILKSIVSDEKVEIKEVDVRKLDMEERQRFMDRFIQVVEEDNEKFLTKFRDRIDRVGIQLPTLEVRFEHLNIEADCYVGRRTLPTLLNVSRYIVESTLALLGIHLAKRKKLTILNDISGIVKPSRMTLLLGPPSSGKTTFLLALADKLDPSLKVEGEITYNGLRLNEFVPRKTSAYISQNDVHVGEMTVRETLDFSARCQGVGTRYELLREIARREKNAGIHPDAEVDLFMKETAVGGAESSLITDYVLKILGLEICKDTLVGDDMQRGISGGQKKRVTIGEMIVGPTKALFMDDISTGLDSSTTFQIVKCLQQIALLTEATIFMSLLQPAPETYDLFDDIILISEGQIVYQGPREHILDFFEACGFRCPERKGTADFLLEVTSRKDQEQYWVDRSKPYRYVGVKEFANQFKRFHVGQQLHNELSNPFDKSQSHAGALVFKKHSVPTTELLKANFHKEWTLIKRNSSVYVSTTVGTIVVALIGSTVFFRTNMHTRNEGDGTTYLGAIIFSIVNNMFNSYAELAGTIKRLPVFYKHRDLLFHPAWTYTLPNALLKIPISLFEAIVWTAVTYYTTGYSPEASRFFKTILVLFFLKEMANACFRFIPAVSRTMTVSNTAGALTTLFVYLLGGFILPRVGTAIVTGRIPVWWSWGHWVSPMTYAFNALAVNEMLASRWMNKLASDNTTRLGVAVLNNFDIIPERIVYWIGVAALLGFALLFNILYTISLVYLNPLGKPQAIISEETANEIDFEQVETKKRRISNSNSKGDIETLQMNSQSVVNGQNKTTEPEPRRGIVLPFTSRAMSFDNVNYYVDMPSAMKDEGIGSDKLQLLKEITGAFRPGVLTALMGVSGAGKTTLMDVLAGRKTGGYIEGDIRISGFPKKQETFARISGYCEQNDIHSPQVTVRESLIYSAFLRLPKEVSNKEKMIFVDEVMDLVELANLRDAIVGLPGVTGLSTERRKRLTIAVELVANPSIIFMDEPTTGLDTRAAAIVMRTVKNTVDTGRTVVCTIHQPSIDIFEAFDELLLLKRGGQVIYSGPLGRHSQKLIEYFESIPGVPKIKDKYNPGTWMLEVSSTAAEIQLKLDFAEHYKSSSLYQQNKALVKELSKPPPGGKDLHFRTQYSQSTWGQFIVCLWKQWWTYWRSPSYNLVRFSFTLATAILIGSIFWQVGTKRADTTELQIIVGVLCTAVMFLGIANSTTVQSIVSLERTVFYRERAAGMYSTLSYALAWVIVEIPYVFVQTTYYTLIVYAMVCFQWTAAKFFWFFFINFFTFLYFTYYGMMVISITPNDLLAEVFAAASYSLFNLFSGFFIPRPRIPKWWIWYYWICPVACTLYGLIISQYGDVEDTIIVPGIMPDPTIKWYIEHHCGYDPNFMGPVAGVLVGFTIFFSLTFAFCIGKLNFQTR